ncbi:hypothetical protein D3C80_1020150 [compost metagenome]
MMPLIHTKSPFWNPWAFEVMTTGLAREIELIDLLDPVVQAAPVMAVAPVGAPRAPVT